MHFVCITQHSTRVGPHGLESLVMFTSTKFIHPKSPFFSAPWVANSKGISSTQEGAISPGDGTKPHPGEHFHFVSVVVREGCYYCCLFIFPQPLSASHVWC